jgi:hypothetical protein
MAEQKTGPTGASVERCIDAVDDEQRRDECRTLVEGSVATMRQRYLDSKSGAWPPAPRPP